jgi:carbamoyltransferase
MCPVNQWCDWAASIQAVTEKTMLHMVNILVKKYGHKNLVLGGGVALNCVANSKIISSGLIRDLWILPSPGDSGNAIGAAAAVGGLHKLNWQGPFLGASVDPEEPSIHIIREVTNRLEKGEIIGWIQGREEFGPRSLGHRSLLADPRRPEMKDRINQIKHRQEFRPFAPSVLEEHAFSYFDMPGRNFNHRYMQLVSRVRNPNSLPAICHVDGSTRVQTVPKSNDPFRKLLEHWSKSTNCSVLLNTSLNIKGQPLISERKQAIQILMDNPIDAVAIGNRLYFKSEKMGLSDEPNDPVTIVEHVDFDNDETDPLHSKINRS